MSYYLHCPYDGSSMIPQTGEAQGKSKCPKCGFVDYHNPKPCVDILIMRGDALLLARRAFEPAKGEWDLPGGFIDSGETAEEAVVREALEETTLHVRVTEYLGSVPDVYVWGNWRVPTLSFCYLVDIVDGEPKAQDDVESLTWVPLDKLPSKLAFEHQIQVIDLLRRRLQQKGMRQASSRLPQGRSQRNCGDS